MVKKKTRAQKVANFMLHFISFTMTLQTLLFFSDVVSVADPTTRTISYVGTIAVYAVSLYDSLAIGRVKAVFIYTIGIILWLVLGMQYVV